MSSLVRNSLFLLGLVAMASSCAVEVDDVPDVQVDEGKADGPAVSGLGGFMSSCYTASGFETGRTCESITREATIPAFNGSELFLSATASASYMDVHGAEVSVNVDVVLEDIDNFFQPEAKVPIVFRAIVCSGRGQCSYRVVSQSLVLDREEGTRTLRGSTASLSLKNSFGAEHVELLKKIEVLVPGVGNLVVLTLKG